MFLAVLLFQTVHVHACVCVCVSDNTCFIQFLCGFFYCCTRQVLCVASDSSCVLFQDAFDNIDEKYRVPLSTDQQQQLDAMLRHIRVESLMAALYECSLLHITVRQDPNAEDYNDNQDQPYVSFQ